MKQSGVFIPSAETSNNCLSDQLLTQSGYIQETSEGMYAYFPLAGKVLDTIKQMTRDEMEKSGVLEVDLPYEQFEHATGKSDEMILLSLIAKEIISSEQLPISVFHIKQNIRGIEYRSPGKGLLYAKEYSLMSGYSFHTDVVEALEHGLKLHEVFTKLATKIGMPYRVMQSKNEKGLKEYDFMAFSECGNETVATSTESAYTVKAELAESLQEERDETVKLQLAEKIKAEGLDLTRLAASFEMERARTLQSFLYEIDGEPTLVLIRGDQKLNEKKLKNIFASKTVKYLKSPEVKAVLGVGLKHMGPVQLPFGVRVIADHAVSTVVNGITGANELDTFLLNVNPGRDFEVDEYLDIRLVQEGEPSPDGNGTLVFNKAVTFARIIEPEPVFSKIAVENKGVLEILTGYYYIDLTRVFGIAAEHFSDHLGLKWPIQLAPYDIHLLIEDVEDEAQRQLVEELHSVMKGYRYRVLYDDRPVSAEQKQYTSNLLGIPVQVVVGDLAPEGFVEVMYRTLGTTFKWRKEEVTEKLQEFFRTE